MKPATFEFLKNRFAGYYQAAPRTVPSSLEQREWGFVFFDRSKEVRMRRHMAFNSRQEVAEYLKTMVPAHVYYSTAYYTFPSAGTMGDKQWTGADLIFDLDADHIVRGVPYDAMLARVKDETIKLLHMLTDELGIARQAIDVVFSGGRGYHIHVKDISFRGWGSPERREVVDYVCGIGLDPALVLGQPLPHVQGWPVRFRDALAEHLEWIRSQDEENAVSYLRSLKGIGKKSSVARAFYENIDDYIDHARDPRNTISLKDRVVRAIVHEEEGTFRERLRERAAFPDEPVTTDIKRLIRMPGSLHGGSGLRVTPVPQDELAAFDPLIDTVVFGEESVSIDCSFALTMPMNGETFSLERGRNSVPEALAVFLCCRGIADLTERVI